MNTKQIPNLFIIGAPKAGTTALVSNLNRHPQIFVPNEKEPRFFDAHIFYDFKKDYPIKHIKDYLIKYEKTESIESKYRIDGSVFNMYSAESISNILKVQPEAKFIIVLRDPLTAVKSMFSQRMKYIQSSLREVSSDFDECWMLMKERKDGLNFPNGCRNKFLFRYDLLYSYENYLPYLFELIPKENFYITSYNKLKFTPNAFYQDIYNFLGIESSVIFENKQENLSYHLKANPFNKILGEAAFRTLRLRRALNLSGDNIAILKKILVRGAIETPCFSDKSDSDIKLFFSKTYKYLKSNNIEL